MSAPELSALKALVAAEEGRQAADQLSDSQIEETEGGTAKGNAMCRIGGPHGLRGTHSSLAAAAGATSAIIASAMGHTGTGVTERHYIKPEALENARTARVVAALN
jgi:integrase